MGIPPTLAVGEIVGFRRFLPMVCQRSSNRPQPRRYVLKDHVALGKLGKQGFWWRRIH